jgi:RNA polymerase sigma-70 factor (TIGR02960 family)
VTNSLLDRARAGDGRAFGELTAPHVRELHLHCYRMLGSVTESDDLLQETLTAAWRGLHDFQGRASLRAWLYRIATNRCLNAIRDSSRRVRAEPVPPFRPPEPSRRGDLAWLQPYPDAWLGQLRDVTPGPAARWEGQETIELAFIVALQRLSPRQAAVLVLGDVLGFSHAEVAGMLDSTATAVKGALQRARASLSRHRDGLRHEPSGGPGSATERDLARLFAACLADGNVDGVVALLTETAWLSMPPASHEYLGPVAIRGFLDASRRWRGQTPLTLVETRSNGQPAFGSHLGHPGAGRPAGIFVLTMHLDRISGITRFLDQDSDRYFGRSGVGRTAEGPDA